MSRRSLPPSVGRLRSIVSFLDGRPPGWWTPTDEQLAALCGKHGTKFFRTRPYGPWVPYGGGMREQQLVEFVRGHEQPDRVAAFAVDLAAQLGGVWWHLVPGEGVSFTKGPAWIWAAAPGNGGAK
jgi:hypothetical protein